MTLALQWMELPTMTSFVQQSERRRHSRRSPKGPIRVTKAVPVLPLSDAQVINVSRAGVALRTMTPMHPGERLSFLAQPHTPPILAQVLACELLPDGAFRIRCRCLLGEFE